MNRFVAIAFLILFAWNSLGFYAGTAIESWLIKEHQEHLLLQSAPDNFYLRLEFSENDYSKLDWIEDHEIVFNGNYYDVAKQRCENGKKILFVIADEQEGALLGKLTKQITHDCAEKNPFSKSKTENVKKIVSIVECVDDLISLTNKFTRVAEPLYCNNCTTQNVQQVPSPPPRLV